MRYLFRGDVLCLVVGLVLVWFEPLFGLVLIGVGGLAGSYNYFLAEGDDSVDL